MPTTPSMFLCMESSLERFHEMVNVKKVIEGICLGRKGESQKLVADAVKAYPGLAEFAKTRLDPDGEEYGRVVGRIFTP